MAEEPKAFENPPNPMTTLCCLLADGVCIFVEFTIVLTTVIFGDLFALEEGSKSYPPSYGQGVAGAIAIILFLPTLIADGFYFLLIRSSPFEFNPCVHTTKICLTVSHSFLLLIWLTFIRMELVSLEHHLWLNRFPLKGPTEAKLGHDSIFGSCITISILIILYAVTSSMVVHGHEWRFRRMCADMNEDQLQNYQIKRQSTPSQSEDDLSRVRSVTESSSSTYL